MIGLVYNKRGVGGTDTKRFCSNCNLPPKQSFENSCVPY